MLKARNKNIIHKLSTVSVRQRPLKRNNIKRMTITQTHQQKHAKDIKLRSQDVKTSKIWRRLYIRQWRF